MKLVNPLRYFDSAQRPGEMIADDAHLIDQLPTIGEALQAAATQENIVAEDTQTMLYWVRRFCQYYAEVTPGEVSVAHARAYLQVARTLYRLSDEQYGELERSIRFFYKYVLECTDEDTDAGAWWLERMQDNPEECRQQLLPWFLLRTSMNLQEAYQLTSRTP
ncbi:hypothetical protein [Salisaeta longa]|uniref:hypothetical protein n=1 Tax=Salisaeta longa TaxID=503170 RepID=UPI0012F9AE55|nr:hypothetical protein [Salisaeta longa]